MTPQPIDEQCINTIRTLSMDAVQRASSGHPDTAMALAPVVYCLWQHFLRFDPQDPTWPNRDRFVLSIGHASMLLYSLLHLCGVKAVNPQYETVGKPAVTLDDIKQFRQWHSKTPGHPELHDTPGVEVTTGPLGQGFANGVGMALAAKMAAARFPGLFAPRVWALVSDGDVMEGVAYEAASIAGHLKLGNLIYIYDDNRITLDGGIDVATAPQAIASGADVLVAGTATFKGGPDAYADNIRRLRG